MTADVRAGSRRLFAIVRKEALQIIRDPAALLISFVLPVMLLFLFAYAISLDIEDTTIAIVPGSDSPATTDLIDSLSSSRWLDVTLATSVREAGRGLVSGEQKAVVVIPEDFDARLVSGGYDRPGELLQVLTDGSQPNTARFASAYIDGAVRLWLAESGYIPMPAFSVQPRFWFNPELESRLVLLPGAIAIVMTMIGTLLTALVVAREWERGTMEALLSTPAGIGQILVGKMLPYFVLGLTATAGCTAISMLLFGLPLRGSPLTLLALSAVFLLPALAQGLLISALSRSQFIASQVALLTGFLPSFLLSGFLFEISSMPTIIQWITLVVPARWFVEGLQTIFLAGDIWPQLVRDMLALAAIGSFFLLVAFLRSRTTVE